MKLTFGNMTVDMNIFNLDGQSGDPAEVNMIYILQSEHFMDDHNESFEEIFKEEIIMFEFEELLNQSSTNKKKPEHSDYFDQDFMEAFEDEVLLYDALTNEINICTSSEGFFDQDLEIYDNKPESFHIENEIISNIRRLSLNNDDTIKLVENKNPNFFSSEKKRKRGKIRPRPPNNKRDNHIIKIKKGPYINLKSKLKQTYFNNGKRSKERNREQREIII
jgi:hypothetical protein